MSATLSTLRIGEVVEVRAVPVASDGTPGHVTPGSPAWALDPAPDGAAISIVPDARDKYLVEVTAIASGSDELYFNGTNVFGHIVIGHETVIVLNASAVGFSIANPHLLKDVTGIFPSGRPNVAVTAFGIDSRQDLETSLPAYALSNVSWLRSNGNVLFDVGAGPVSTNPVTGVLTLTLWGVEDGTCTITVTAENSAGAVITGQLLVTVVGALVIGLQIVET